MLTPRALLVSATLAALAVQAADAASCSSFSERFGGNLEGVCVCTAASCDDVSSAYLSLASDQVGVFQTSLAGDRLAYSTVPLSNATATAAGVEVTLDASIAYQKITGFGGAFTDATSINAYKLSPTLQEKLLDAYFGDNGLQYTLGRVPIGSTDFSESVYSYNPVDGDLAMVNFSIDMDKSPATHKLAFLKRALAKSSRALPLFASSWAPPAWMTREKKVENSHMIGEPGEPYWQALALYYKRFLDEYKKEGVEFWAMTAQNEPHEQFGFLAWQQLRFNASQERDFIKKDLGPLLKQAHPNVKLIMMDDQKDLLPDWRDALTDPASRQFVSGVGVHWYKNLDFVAEGLGNFKELADFHTAFPDVFILATEACEGSMPSIIGTGTGVRIQEPAIIWKRGENYARDIIGDLANYAVGWTDWNMVLDTTGGPNWAGNLVDAPILVDEKSGNEFYKQPMYYIMGHFAKFLPAGSVRIELRVGDEASMGSVDKVAFLTPTKQIVVIFSNRRSNAVPLTLRDAASGRVVSITLPANAVQTVLFPTPSAATPSPVPTTTQPPVPTTTQPTPTTPTATTPCPLPTPSEPAPTTPAPTTERPAC